MNAIQKTRLWLCLAMALLATIGVNAQAWDVAKAGLNDKIPTDASIRTGTLKNGMRYYIRKNAEPEKRVEMRLAVNAGSVLENDDQQGLAHFTEHMGFNGTKNFKKSELVDYLESIGMRFGADLNAYTSFDETVYMLQVPTDKPSYIEKGLQILEDWAHNVTFDDTEIDKERGVVIEEWRLGRGAFDRLNNKTLPIELYQSQYAQRLPIGKKDILENFKHETARQFYHDWYRPDLQAIIIVGDIDPAKMEEQVKKQFSAIPAVTGSKPRNNFPIPYHEDTKVAIATDKEMPYAMVQLNYMHDKLNKGTVKDYRTELAYHLFSGMVSNRLKELTQQADPPFILAQSNISSFFRDKAAYGVFSIVKPDNIQKGLETLIQENERVKRFGFTQTEFDRQKTELLKGYETSYKERDKTESKQFAAEYIRNFLEDETVPGIAAEYELTKRFVPEISLAEVNALAKEWIRNGNNSVIITAPEKEGVTVPTEAGVRTALSNAKSLVLTAYKDVSTDKPLMAKKPNAGKITSEKTNKEMGITEWQLSNGAKVVFKPTDFKNDEILFGAWSPGGTSLVNDKNYVSASHAADIINNSGISAFDANTLEKMLSGKVANASPTIGELSEGFTGEAAPADMETMLQLVNLYFTDPRKDKTGFEAYKSQMKGFVANNSLTPEGVFRDTVTKVMSQGNYRRRPMNTQLLDEMNLEEAYSIYKDRFADAGDFIFFFVGNVDQAKLRPMVETYLASLPSNGRKESWKDLHINPPKGIVKRTVKKGTEPKSLVQIAYSGPFDWNVKNRAEADATMRVLNIMMRETMREDKSGVYGVYAGFAPAKIPQPSYRVNISFGCAPNNIDMLVSTAMEQINLLKKDGANEKNLQKVKETMRRERETNLKTNRFWMSMMSQYYSNGENPSEVLKYDKIVEGITPEAIKKAANLYFKDDNYAQLMLVPEN
jgi:zinc protease